MSGCRASGRRGSTQTPTCTSPLQYWRARWAMWPRRGSGSGKARLRSGGRRATPCGMPGRSWRLKRCVLHSLLPALAIHQINATWGRNGNEGEAVLEEGLSALKKTSTMPCGMLGSLCELRMLAATMHMVAEHPLSRVLAQIAVLSSHIRHTASRSVPCNTTH